MSSPLLHKKIWIAICIAFLISLTHVFAFGHYYSISVHYKDKNLEVKNIEVRPLLEDLETLSMGGYKLFIEDFAGNKIYSTTFVIPNQFLVDSFNEEGESIAGGLEELSEMDFELQIPYFENAKQIKIISPQNKEAKVSVEGFAQNTCGDKICQSLENTQSCPEDCKLTVTDEGLARKEEEKAAAKKKAEITYIIFIIILVITVALAGYYLIKKQKK